LAGEVIGVSFDGTGYGADGAIWGGEFLLCNGSSFERMAHLKYIKMLGGDSSMKEAWKSAICYKYAWETGYRDTAVSDEITLDLAEIMSHSKIENENRPLVEAALLNNVNTIESSSMGRLFDAVAALLDIKDYNDYEGQCAILLEDAAARAQRNPGNCTADDLALKFHNDVAQMILDRCSLIRSEKETSKVALTGGTFQNKILMEETLRLLRNAEFEVYYNISVSPNDGGIALGQTYIAVKGSNNHGN